jgi:hypothetical protein
MPEMFSSITNLLWVLIILCGINASCSIILVAEVTGIADKLKGKHEDKNIKLDAD